MQCMTGINYSIVILRDSLFRLCAFHAICQYVLHGNFHLGLTVVLRQWHHQSLSISIIKLGQFPTLHTLHQEKDIERYQVPRVLTGDPPPQRTESHMPCLWKPLLTLYHLLFLLTGSSYHDRFCSSQKSQNRPVLHFMKYTSLTSWS